MLLMVRVALVISPFWSYKASSATVLTTIRLFASLYRNALADLVASAATYRWIKQLEVVTKPASQKETGQKIFFGLPDK